MNDPIENPVQTVLCINAGPSALTDGKTYSVVSKDDIFMSVLNDQGNVVAYFRERFTEVKQEDVTMEKLTSLGFLPFQIETVKI